MATQSPFSMLADALGKLTENLKAPTWLVDEAQQRLVLFLNHVLMQEPEAQARLKRQSGRVVRLPEHQGRVARAGYPVGLTIAPIIAAPGWEEAYAGLLADVAAALDGLAPDLARQVADQLMAKDALGAHARDELGISHSLRARPVQAALAEGAVRGLAHRGEPAVQQLPAETLAAGVRVDGEQVQVMVAENHADAAFVFHAELEDFEGFGAAVDDVAQHREVVARGGEGDLVEEGLAPVRELQLVEAQEFYAHPRLQFEVTRVR